MAATPGATPLSTSGATPAATPRGTKPVVGVVGAGTMGHGIAQVAAWAGHAVVMFDIDEAAVQRGLKALASFLRKGAERGRYPLEQAEAGIARVRGTVVFADLAACQLVIEAAPEILELKVRTFAQLEEAVAETAILASNTSTLSIASLSARLKHPGRVCGMHFFNPAPILPLVEVIRGPYTTRDTLQTVVALASAWGKTPIECADTPGFVVNRVARPYYGEALRLLGEGVAGVEELDLLARDAGFPMGPFELMDLIGIDVNYAAARSVFEGFFMDPRFRPHPIQRAMVESGKLGRKTGAGYYDYHDGAGPG